MLRFLFPRLTVPRGQALFDALVGEARKPAWFTQGGVPDTLDGRFAVLTTVIALATVRLEQGGAAGTSASVALTERFVEAMDAEHRQMGLGDPALGKTVRKLLGSLSRRVELWRRAVDEPGRWEDAVESSLFGGSAGGGDIRHSSQVIRSLWERLESSEPTALGEGTIG